jgi:hypothetical protein
MERELTNEELALWCEEWAARDKELTDAITADVLPREHEFWSRRYNRLWAIAKRLRNPPDSSRVRETAKELPEGDYGDRVWAFDRRCMQWRDADVGDIRFIERKHPGKGYYTHWMPLPPAPKETK